MSQDLFTENEGTARSPFLVDDVPLCLKEYIRECESGLPDRPQTARIAARYDNLIVLEFDEAPPASRPPPGPRFARCRAWQEAAMILLLVICALACALALGRH